jgi:hyperosmotically inducible protein
MHPTRIRRSPIAVALAAMVAIAGCGESQRSEPPRASERITKPPTSASPTDRATAASAAAQSAQTGGVSGARSDAAASDAALSAKVKSALASEPGVSSDDINVDTRGKRVILSGQVDSPELRQRALQAARNVDGVEGVVDRLAVRRG